MLVLIAAYLAHLFIARYAVSPWWIPDITLVGLLLAIGKTPERWLSLSLIAGLLMVLWAVRFPAQVFASYLAGGWAIRTISTRWDVTDLRVQCVIAALAGGVMRVWGLWLDNLWSVALLGLASLQALLTGCCVPGVRWLFKTWTAARDRRWAAPKDLGR